jgi:hypothetical protein
MNKTQLLSDTENLLYCKGKTHYIIIETNKDHQIQQMVEHK